MTRTADHAAAHGWHALAVSDVRLQLESAADQVLSPREAARRFDQHGPNTLPEAKHRSMWTVFAGQFVSPLIYILFVAAVIALAMGHRGDAGVILIVVFLTALIGTVQEGRVVRSMEWLHQLSALEAAEAALTGESLPVGKHPEPLPEGTGLAIATALDIARAGDIAVDGAELEAMADQDLRANLHHISVFARVHPAQKLRIVEAFQAEKYVVAMTGDGVNDALALARADVGVAMGITGTEVARGAAKIVISDATFATIVKAVQEGRLVHQNLKGMRCGDHPRRVMNRWSRARCYGVLPSWPPPR